jgi:ribosomal protein S15P/S13E
MSANSPKIDDFFQLLKEEDRKGQGSFSEDEILFQDEDGNWKILKAGQISDFKETEAVSKPQSISAVACRLPQEEKKQALAEVTELPQKPVTVLPVQAVNLDQKIQSIIQDAKIHFTDQETDRRFKNIIALRLKNVRNHLQTRDILSRSVNEGGMGFTSEESERIMQAISQEINRPDFIKKSKPAGEFRDLQAEAEKILSAVPLPEKTPIFSPLGRPNKEAEIKPKEETVSAVAEIKPAAAPLSDQKGEINATSARVAELPVVKKEEIRPIAEPAMAKKEVKPIVESAEPRRVVLPSPPAAKPKKERKMRYESKLVGPVEEIRTMALVDFRRLGDKPELAIEKILAKIALLEKESFTKKSEGIKAWKESQIHHLYLDLADQSMEERRPINEVIAENLKTNQNGLTQEEVEAIMTLNQRLRY